MPFALPRLSSGTTQARSFDTHGNPTLSPRPSIRRTKSSDQNPTAAPMRLVAPAQITSPPASIQCAP